MAASDLQARLESALGDTYTIERELGGGGMSRVFLAEETRLGRQVVIKVLPPEMAAGVSVERFEREIKLAAKLQHPHVVQLLTAGSHDDLLWYVMPFIKGESLRAKLAREGELPVPETVRILKEVLDALQYAHSEQVVHRDIKPDNILLTGNHAVVTDFGVAKAVSASTDESNLTSLGVALGTPAYMSPEQAAADPHVDHRADIYAVGAMAYEMLCGRPPFTGTTAQQVLAAHMTNEPEPVTTHRPTVPPALNEVILRCLHKKPADRFQRADEMVPYLDAVLTPSGGMTPTGTQPIATVDYAAVARQSHPLRVAGLFTVGSFLLIAVAYGFVQLLGLPDWVTLGAVVLLAAGLPVMLLTGHHERKRAVAAITGMHVATPVGFEKHFTWRKAMTGGGMAFGGLAILTIGFMASRLMGIGPGATLMSSGFLGERDRLILAEFENTTGDSTMGEAVTELLRIDLSQSPIITIVDPGRVSDLLERMARSRDDALTTDLAREMAQREGLKAFIAGEIRQVGEGFVISARIASASTGEALATAGSTADDPAGIINAVDDLSADLREQIGESLKSVRADPPLERLTTTSLEALRLYAQADRVSDDGDYRRAIGLLEDAVERDTLFAMAYRRLGTYKTNPSFIQQFGVSGDSALRRAYMLRHRVSDRERFQIEASYASRVQNDPEGMVTSLLALLDKYPDDAVALNNIGNAYSRLGRFADRDEVHRRAIDARVASSITYSNHGFWLVNKGDLATADTILQLFTERYPGSSEVDALRAVLADARGDWDEVERIARNVITNRPSEEPWARGWLSVLAEREGRLVEAGRQGDLGIQAQARLQSMSDEERDFQMAILRAERDLWYANNRVQLRGQFDELLLRNDALATNFPDQIQGFRLGRFVGANTLLGRPSEADAILQTTGDLIPRNVQETTGGRGFVSSSRADIAAANGEFMRAVELRRQRRTEIDCAACDLVEIASYFDQASESDSALAYYQEYVQTPWGNEPRWLPVAYRRLGELYEDRNDFEKAIDYYNRFVELWANADPQLQPIVADIRSRIARLVAER